MTDTQKHGKQFSGERFRQASDNEGKIVRQYLETVFDATNIVPTEPETEYDNFTPEKKLHQVLDYGGTDYVIDPFNAPPFGVNHRTHTPTETELRLDLRKETGTKKPSELDELIDGVDTFSLLPRYATRFKKPGEQSSGWFRAVRLQPLVRAIKDGGLRPHDTWEDSNGVVAWYFEYDLLRNMGILTYESEVEL